MDFSGVGHRKENILDAMSTKFKLDMSRSGILIGPVNWRCRLYIVCGGFGLSGIVFVGDLGVFGSLKFCWAVLTVTFLEDGGSFGSLPARRVI